MMPDVRMLHALVACYLLLQSCCGFIQQPSVRCREYTPRTHHRRRTVLRMVYHHLATPDEMAFLGHLLLAGEIGPSLSDLQAEQVPDLAAAAADLGDLAGTAQASVSESLNSIGNLVGSFSDTISSAKNQVADITRGSVDALKSQVDELGSRAFSPFHQLGENFSSSLNGGLDSLKTGAQGTVEAAQTQLGQTVTENIGNPLQERLGQIFNQFGTSPEELLKEEETWVTGVQQTIKEIERVATPSRTFYAENAAVLPLWVSMIVWPEEKMTKKLMGSYAPVVAAALVYVWLTYECFQNPVSLQGFASGITNLPGLTKGFGEEVSVASAWSHFLAEDLFIGRFVYLDGRKNKVFTRHSLLLCYLFGPAGLLSHLLTRGVYSVATPIRDIMEAGSQQSPRAPPKEASATKAAPLREPPTKKATPSKAPPAKKAASSVSLASSESKEIVAKAKREAEEILAQARSAGASLLEAAETDALLILKGAEVEKEAMLKGNKPHVADVKSEPSKN